MRQIEVRSVTFGKVAVDAVQGSTLTVEDGALAVLDNNASDVAVYAPGAWLSARFVTPDPDPADEHQPA